MRFAQTTQDCGQPIMLTISVSPCPRVPASPCQDSAAAGKKCQDERGRNSGVAHSAAFAILRHPGFHPVAVRRHRDVVLLAAVPAVFQPGVRRVLGNALAPGAGISAALLQLLFLRQLEPLAGDPDRRLDHHCVTDVPDRALHELLDLCQREHIEPLLYLPPEGSTFRGWYTPQMRRTIERYLSKLSGDYGIGLLDATHWCDDADFRDSHHLMAGAADRFTHQFGSHVLPTLLAGNRTPPKGGQIRLGRRIVGSIVERGAWTVDR